MKLTKLDWVFAAFTVLVVAYLCVVSAGAGEPWWMGLVIAMVPFVGAGIGVLVVWLVVITFDAAVRVWHFARRHSG